MATPILLLRHGQSVWNEVGRWQGQADPPLTVLGLRQAEHAAARLARFDVLVCSDLRRARQTADALSVVHGQGEPVPIQALRERAAGDWEGVTRDEIEAGWPGYLDAGRRPDGFEDDDALLERTHEALVDLARDHTGATIVAVCHGGVIRAHERRHAAPDERVPNLGGRWLHVGATGSIRLGDRVVLVDPAELTAPPET